MTTEALIFFRRRCCCVVFKAGGMPSTKDCTPFLAVSNEVSLKSVAIVKKLNLHQSSRTASESKILFNSSFDVTPRTLVLIATPLTYPGDRSGHGGLLRFSDG